MLQSTTSYIIIQYLDSVEVMTKPIKKIKRKIYRLNDVGFFFKFKWLASLIGLVITSVTTF